MIGGVLNQLQTWGRIHTNVIEYEYIIKSLIRVQIFHLKMYLNTNKLLFKCIRIRIHLKYLKLKNITSDINIYLCTYIQYVHNITDII